MTTALGAVRSVIRGVDASAVGTLAMDTLLYRRYRGAGGRTAFISWEIRRSRNHSSAQK